MGSGFRETTGNHSDAPKFHWSKGTWTCALMTTTDFAGFFLEEDRIKRLQRLRLQQIQHIELLRLEGITDSLAHAVLVMIEDELDQLEAAPAVFNFDIVNPPPRRSPSR